MLHGIDKPVIVDKTITLTNGPGSLTCQTVYLAQAQIVSIGGPGREFEVNGQNFPSSKRDSEAGSWRVEVSPAEPATRDYFLHILRTAGTTPVAPSVEFLQTEEGMGVRIVDDGQTYEVHFSTTGSLTGHLRIVGQTGEIVADRGLAVEVSESVRE